MSLSQEQYSRAWFHFIATISYANYLFLCMYTSYQSIHAEINNVLDDQKSRALYHTVHVHTCTPRWVRIFTAHACTCLIEHFRTLCHTSQLHQIVIAHVFKEGNRWIDGASTIFILSGCTSEIHHAGGQVDDRLKIITVVERTTGRLLLT